MTSLVKFVILFMFFRKSVSFCEKSYMIICDDLSDVEKNETWTWRYVLIDPNHFTPDPPSHALTSLTRFSNVKSLTIVYQLNSIKPLAFARVSHLEHLNLYDNELREIEDNTFANMPKLRDLYLENNQIEHLGRSLFKNNSLELVSLSHNEIRSITTCFYDCEIKWIKINHNYLESIKERSFPKNLEKLELDHNPLTSLNAGIFENLVNLKELSIKHNRLKTMPDISPLIKITLLHLSYNQIGSFSYRFDRHKDLLFLDLSSNLIRNFDVDSVSSNSSSPPIVLLMFNRITNLNISDPTKKTDLALFGNPLVCDCYFKIQKIVADYKHSWTCNFNFAKDKLPVCLENGKCGEKDVIESDIDNFLKTVNVSQDKDACNLYL